MNKFQTYDVEWNVINFIAVNFQWHLINYKIYNINSVSSKHNNIIS